ncbi:MAG: extracellular solute-binding protein, partial [Lachnospiraceae bacterium]|nr:extracellular solute-binding protein [Lachnospiraceae bacterium]
MAVVLTGCQNSSPATGADSAATDNETKTESGAASGARETGGNGNFNPEGLPIVKEKETFTIAVPQTSTLKTAAEKQCVIETEEATNIHIEWIEIPASGWEEKINIMFSTDSLPDAILGDVDMSRNFDQLVALDEYLEQYAPNVTAFFDTRDDYPNALRSPDGKVHTLPVGDESTHNIIDSHLWINQTWLDNLSLKMPETPEELKEVLIAFRDQDPNGNGKKDEIPFTFQDSWGWGTSIENIFGPFGVLENGYHVIT